MSSPLTDFDLHLFAEGTHAGLYEKLGAQPWQQDGRWGTHFAVWAPNARQVDVIADFNDWRPGLTPLQPRGTSGIWEGFVPDVSAGTRYKYRIVSAAQNYTVEKADPLALAAEEPPRTASVVWHPTEHWGDHNWMEIRRARHAPEAPIAIYEVHLGSWMRRRDGSFYNYRDIAPKLAEYVRRMGFTHVELLPIMEHPFYGSWGYQITGYFAPTARYGTPGDFLYLVDCLHQHEIGVILDWVPSHFPDDEHGLVYFDGTHLYEHADPRQGFHPDWNSYIFNYGRKEVVSFLLSSAMFWLDRFHADGLRVDAVASMLYLDYSRGPGQWIPNRFGGRENLEAIDFLRQLNTAVHQRWPEALMIAEESTAWPMVSRPIYVGGLGFTAKWDMGWMHDTLQYMQHDPVHRKYHHDKLAFRMLYAFTEDFVLPLSHDEVVHGKGSLLGKMPGDPWQKFANLRALLGYMYAQPAKKLLFMGGEFGQWSEWNHDQPLDWSLAQFESHAGLQRWVSHLNDAYRSEPALHELDWKPEGFEWIDCHDADRSVLSFLRRAKDGKQTILVVCNFTPVPRTNYRIGVPAEGLWRERLNSDAREYGGSGWGNLGGATAAPLPAHGRNWSINLTLPPLSTLLFIHEGTSA